MNNAETILVIILSTFLAIFLLCAIMLLVKLIQVTKQIKRITDKAEEVVDKAETVGEFFQHATGRLTAVKLLNNVIQAVTQYESKTKRKGRSDD